jgi:hypothetical protein
MKRGTFTQGTINLVGQLGIAQRVQIDLIRSKQRGRCIGKLAEYRLAADDGQFTTDLCSAPVLEDGGTGTQQVFQLIASHRNAA